MKEKHNFTLTGEVFGILRAMAKQAGVSMSAIIELAVRAYAGKNKDQ